MSPNNLNIQNKSKNQAETVQFVIPLSSDVCTMYRVGGWAKFRSRKAVEGEKTTVAAVCNMRRMKKDV